MKRTIKQSLIMVALTTVAVVVFFLGFKGIPLWGVPGVDEIEKVEIRDNRFDKEVRVFTDPEKIGLAQKLTNFLNYKPGKAPEGEPVITIVYYGKDGKLAEVSANTTTVWWNGRRRLLKEEEIFVTLSEGIFFNDRLAGQE